MGYKRSAWWKPANGTQGDTEDKNLVEAYPRAMDDCPSSAVSVGTLTPKCKVYSCAVRV